MSNYPMPSDHNEAEDAKRQRRRSERLAEQAVSEPTCQWCGAAVRQVMRNDAGEPVLILFCCASSRWTNGPWHLGNDCRERCAEQMRRLRQVLHVAVQQAVDSATKGD